MGWIPLICEQRGIRCKGLEISRQLIEHAQNVGRELGLSPDIELGNIEETDIGAGQWDVIIAQSVFEHVQNWRLGLQKVYAGLKPGGVLFFESTNKFAPVSGEYHLPFYGWLPDAGRYALRVRAQGPDIMTLGIDFNQFTYPLLRRTFRRLGFSRVLDRMDLMDTSGLRGWKRAAAEATRKISPLRHLILLFRQTTIFICVK
jgi:SAM-dependent methyltransferase